MLVHIPEKLVRQAILRELGRDGQVLFVHNRVQSIYAMAQHLRKLVPEARIELATVSCLKKNIQSDGCVLQSRD